MLISFQVSVKQSELGIGQLALEEYRVKSLEHVSSKASRQHKKKLKRAKEQLFY